MACLPGKAIQPRRPGVSGVFLRGAGGLAALRAQFTGNWGRGERGSIELRSSQSEPLCLNRHRLSLNCSRVAPIIDFVRYTPEDSRRPPLELV
jgi:hypothetical protein